MKIDQFGRRLIAVPWKTSPAIPLALDLSDLTFWKDLFQLLGIKSDPLNHLGIQSDYQHQTFITSDQNSIPSFAAEIFAHEYPFMSIGSARHLIWERFLWKGVGRNQLAVLSDYNHAWGGMDLREGVAEFIFSQILGPNLAVPVKGLFRYVNRDDGRNCFLIRDLNLPRLATVPISFNSDLALSKLRGLIENFSKCSGSDAFESMLMRIIHQHRRGFIPRSPTTANFDIAGRCMDLQGSVFLDGSNLEIQVQQGEKLQNPLTPVFWIIEKYFIPLYGRLFSLSESSLISRFNDVKIRELRFNHSENTPIPASEITATFTPWIVANSSGDKFVTPTEFISRKIDLLSFAIEDVKNWQESQMQFESVIKRFNYAYSADPLVRSLFVENE